MDGIIGMVNSITAYNTQKNEVSSADTTKADEKVTDIKKTGAKKTGGFGKTIGKPELSEKAAKYYESLKKKYSNMDFILVDEENKEKAKSEAAGYANANKMVVLIDEDKIEKMASDENYRKQYEGIIANAAKNMPAIKNALSTTSANVKGYGMQVDDNGVASYFAVIDKANEAQKERIEKKAEEKKADKKAEKKKAEEKIEKKKAEKKDTEKNETKKASASDTVIVTASSIEELVKKIQDHEQMYLSDNVMTPAEKQVGQSFDFSV